MTKKEYCMAHPAIAYYPGLDSLEIHGIEYGTEDYLYGVSGGWKDFHRLKIHYTRKGDAYVRLYGRRIPLADCLRKDVL